LAGIGICLALICPVASKGIFASVEESPGIPWNLTYRLAMLSGRNRQQSFLQEDFWPGTTFVLPVTHTEPAIAAAPSVNA